MALQYAEGSLAVEVLLNPTLHTLMQCLRNVLRSPTGAVQLIYAGATFEETGSWVLRDGAFSAYNFYELVQAVEEVEPSNCVNAIASENADDSNVSGAVGQCKGHRTIAEHLSCHDIVLHFHTERPGEWAVLPSVFASAHLQAVASSMTSSLIVAELASAGSAGKGSSSTAVRVGARNRTSPSSAAVAAASSAASNSKRHRHLFHFDLNPEDSADGVQGSAALIDYLSEALAKYYADENRVKSKNTGSRFANSADADLVDSVGYIKLSRPTVYVFPGGQGDCALFGLDNGFTMLMDGGFLPAEKSFWNFVRHLQRLDSVVVSLKTFLFYHKILNIIVCYF